MVTRLFGAQVQYLPTPTMSVGVGRIFECVCLFVCLFVRSITNNPKVFKLDIGNSTALGYPRSDMI